MQRLPDPVNHLSTGPPNLPVSAEQAAAILATPVELAPLELTGPPVEGVRAFQYLPLGTRARGHLPDAVELYLLADMSLAERLVRLVGLFERAHRQPPTPTSLDLHIVAWRKGGVGIRTIAKGWSVQFDVLNIAVRVAG